MNWFQRRQKPKEAQASEMWDILKGVKPDPILISKHENEIEDWLKENNVQAVKLKRRPATINPITWMPNYHWQFKKQSDVVKIQKWLNGEEDET